MNIENQNYKILVSTQQEADEIQKIFFACGFKWASQRWAEYREVRLGFFIKTFYKSRSLVETTCTDHQEITLHELREFFKKSPWGQIESLKAQLAQYQSDEFVLVPKKELSTWYLDEAEKRIDKERPEVIGGWISVEDRLPKERTLVITYNEDGEIETDYAPFLGRITHWQPLPLPPRVGK